MEERKKSLYFEAAGMPASGAWAEKRRLAAALRRVVDRLGASEAAEDELRRAADAAEHFAATLDALPKRQRLWGYAEAANAGDVGAFFDQSPLIGLSNPISPPMKLEAVGERVHGSVVFGTAYEGPPGHVHGGFVAAAFDEVLGYAQSMTGNPGMTASLQVRYRRPTPLGHLLEFDAGVDRIEGRKIFASGVLTRGGEVTAEAEAVFVSVDPARFQQMLEQAASGDKGPVAV